MRSASDHRPGRGKGVLRAAARVFLGSLLLSGIVWFGYTHRPQPGNTRRALFEGVTYAREARRAPRPMVIHIVTVDLTAAGIQVLVTPGEPKQERPLRARTTSQFIDEFRLQVAINGDFFFPWHSRSPWDYYPHVGDTVAVQRFASSRGVVYSGSGGTKDFPTLHVARGNEAGLKPPRTGVYNAISGSEVLLRRGRVPTLPDYARRELAPRTAVGVDRAGKRLILVVVDGRQPNFSEGMTLLELSEILREQGAFSALNLDGGGSTTLVIEGDNGRPQILNSPIDNRIPGRERPVANHLGIYARRTGR